MFCEVFGEVCERKTPAFLFLLSLCHTIQFVVRNVARVELDSTSTTVARNVERKVTPCVRAFTLVLFKFRCNYTFRSRL